MLLQARHWEILERKALKSMLMSWAPMALACNPRNLGGRDQEDLSLRSAQADGLQDLVSKIPNTKKGWQSGSSGRVPS
jgi:hypothetical protein